MMVMFTPFSSRFYRLQNRFCFKAGFTGKESKSNKHTVVWMITVSRTRREPVGHWAHLTPHVLTMLRLPSQITSQTFRSTYPEGKRIALALHVKSLLLLSNTTIYWWQDKSKVTKNWKTGLPPERSMQIIFPNRHHRYTHHLTVDIYSHTVASYKRNPPVQY